MKKDAKSKDDDKIDHILNGLNVTVGDLKGLITDKPAPLTEHNTSNKTKKAGNSSDAGVPKITTSNSTTGADGVIITAQKKTLKKDDKRVDHTLDGLDVTMGALKGLVTDSSAPLT